MAAWNDDPGGIAEADVIAFVRYRGGSPGTVDSALVRSLDELRGSDDPAVTLSALARASVPEFADGCELELGDGAGPSFRVTFPAESTRPSGAGPGADIRVQLTPFRAGPTAGYPPYAGLVTHWWTGGTPSGAEEVVADLMVKHGLALVERERLAAALGQSEDRAAGLALKAISSRSISLAIGIVMHQQGLSADDAENQLRQRAADSSCRLADFAAGVVRAGSLRDARPGLRSHLTPVGDDGTLRR